MRFALAAFCLTFFAGAAAAQDVNAGKLAYTTPQVSGQNSCSASACHTADPLLNQNRILKAADDPGAIGAAVNTIRQMAFLKGVLTTQQFIDLAAYVGNPGAAAGAPAAQVAPASLTFPATAVGNSASSLPFIITNTGTADLIVSSVVTSHPEFSFVSRCGVIAANASCDVSVGFTPAAAGPRSGTLTVNHNAMGGSSRVVVSGVGTATALEPGIQVTPSSLAFGSVAVGAVSAASQITITSTGTAPLVLSSFSGLGPAFAISGGTCAQSTALASGASCTLILRFTPTSAGVQSSALVIDHNAAATPVSVKLTGAGTASPGTLNSKTMVEYFHTPLNYYFITSRDDEKNALDKIADFQRTGFGFTVYAAPVSGSKALSRFYFDQIAARAARGSHLYTLLDSDKAALIALNPGNTQAPRLPYNEGVDSWAFPPLIAGPGGFCASGQAPVYRLFRGSALFPDDPNHRFTTSLSVYDALVAQGWDGEGVAFCVPAP